MSNIVTIDDSMSGSFYPGGNGGLVMRDFKSYPQGCYAGAPKFDESFLIPEKDIPDLILQQEADKSSLQHVGDRIGIKALDQNGNGYCWSYSTTMAAMLVEARENKPHVPLSGHMPACIIKGYRDEGGWNAQSLEFAVKKGIASQKLWPQGSMSRSNDTPEMWADAETHKVTEFWDLSERGDEVRHQLASLLIMNIPVMVDFNWWGHSVCAVRLMKMDPFTIRIRNSWSETWGDRGYGDLVGNKAIPNGAAAPRASKAA